MLFRMRSLTAIALLVTAALALAACGSEDEDQATPASASGQTIEVSATDFALDPPTIELEGPGEYTFRLTNDGGTEHALEIDGQSVEEETETIGPGETAELTITLEAGEYEMYCPVDGHREMGMEGTVSVGGAAAGGGTTTDGDGTTTDDDGTTTDEDSGGYNY
jgi:plastocyanin